MIKYLVFITLIPFMVLAESLQFEISGDAAILINADTGMILFEKDSHKPLYPASVTKIPAVLFALKIKGKNLDETVIAEQEALGAISQEAKRKSGHKLPAYWLEPDGLHIGIRKGEVFTYRELLAACLIASANDASNVVAMGISKSIPLYMEHLNAYLKAIGCKNTHLLNPHGLHHPDHKTTAYDLAVMGCEALKEPFIREHAILPRYIRPKTDLQNSATYLHTNALIRKGKSYYANAIGLKTGYHAKAKSVIMAAAESDGRTLIAVLMGYADRKKMFEDVKQLFEKAFNQPKMRKVFLKSGTQKFTKKIERGDKPLRTYIKEDFSLEFFPAEDPEVTPQLIWKKPLAAPIKKDQVVAELQLVSPQGAIIKKNPLLAEESVNVTWPYSWSRKVPLFLNNHPVMAVLLLILVACSLAISTWKVVTHRS